MTCMPELIPSAIHYACLRLPATGIMIILAEVQWVKVLDWFSFLCTLIGLGGELQIQRQRAERGGLHAMGRS